MPRLSGADAVFYIYFVVSLAALGYCAWMACQLSRYVGFTLLPLLALVVAFDNLAVAVVMGDPGIPNDLLRTRFAVHSFVVPLFLVCMFELNYEVHKERSANFFGCITFDDGRRSKSSFTSQLVRYSIWMTSFVLVILSVIGAAAFIVKPSDYVRSSRFTNGGLQNPDGDGDGTASLSELLDFALPLLLLVFSFYTGASLWRYGTTISVDVRATIANPWMAIVPASLLYLLALLLTPRNLSAPYWVSLTMLLLLLSLISTSRLIATNLVTLRTETDFLHHLGAAMGLSEAPAPELKRGHSFAPGGGVVGIASDSGALDIGPSIAQGGMAGVGKHAMPMRSASIARPADDGLRPRSQSASSRDSESARAKRPTLGPGGLDEAEHLPSMPMRAPRGGAGARAAKAKSLATMQQQFSSRTLDMPAYGSLNVDAEAGERSPPAPPTRRQPAAAPPPRRRKGSPPPPPRLDLSAMPPTQLSPFRSYAPGQSAPESFPVPPPNSDGDSSDSDVVEVEGTASWESDADAAPAPRAQLAVHARTLGDSKAASPQRLVSLRGKGAPAAGLSYYRRPQAGAPRGR